MNFRYFDEGDYLTIVKIYKEGIDTGIATFQTETTHWQAWHTSHLQHCRLAIFDNELMLGWAALSPVSSRCVYEGVAEVSIYIATNYQNKGIGKVLLQQLISESENNGIWTLQSGIFRENINSIQLHEKCGFRVIGYREKIAQKNGVWKDNILMEKRSKIIGT